MDASPECNGGLHGLCPGYYKMTHPCRCGCHERVCPTEEHESEQERYDNQERKL
jgi:hypothetical protein